MFGASGKLWVQSLSSGVTAALPATERGLFPFWSPDSRSIGFFAGGKLKTIDAAGGPAQVLCDAPTPRGGSWGRGGDIVFAADFRGGLSRVPASGGTPVAATKLDAAHHTTHRWPWFLPDGKHFLYLAANHANPKSQPTRRSTSDRSTAEQDRRLMASYGSVETVPGWLLTVRDNNLMAMPFDEDRATVALPGVSVASDANFDAGVWRGVFTVSRTGLLAYQLTREGAGGQLTWFDMSGHATGTLGERSESYALRLSPDGRRATVIQGDPNNDIWIYELERGVRTRLTTNAQVLPSPLWSPDGSEIAFTGGAATRADPGLRRGHGPVVRRGREESRLSFAGPHRDDRLVARWPLPPVRPGQHRRDRHLGGRAGAAGQAVSPRPDAVPRHGRSVFSRRAVGGVRVDADRDLGGLRHGVPRRRRALPGVRLGRPSAVLEQRTARRSTSSARRTSSWPWRSTAAGPGSRSGRRSRCSRSRCSSVRAWRAPTPSRPTGRGCSPMRPPTCRAAHRARLQLDLGLPK